MSASLFADGHLDTLFCQAIVPAAVEVGLEPRRGPYLWLMRYGLGGDHWKIRLHAEEDTAERFRRALERHASQAVAALPGEAGDGKPISSSVVIDDLDAELHAEGVDGGGQRSLPRGLRWTGYRRSHVCLGGRPLHRQDAYCAAFTRALAHGTSALVDGVEPGAAGSWSHGQRFTFLVKLLVDGLVELDLGASVRSEYLEYHRDTLLRSTAGERSVEQAIADGRALFDRRLDGMADGGARLLSFVDERLASGRAERRDGRATGLWRGGLGAGLDVIRPLAEGAEDLRTFADRPYFLPIFKIFQGMANQVGLNLIEEAYIHHLLLRATGAARDAT